MQFNPIPQTNLNIQFENYNDITTVFNSLEGCVSKLNADQKTCVIEYIRKMDATVIDQLRGNGKLLKSIQKVIDVVGSGLCSNIQLGKTQEFCAHKTLLASQSDYFRRMLYGEFKEKDSEIIDLDTIPPEILKKIIKYTNTGEIKLDDDIGGLLLYADRLAFIELKNLIESTLIHYVLVKDIEGENLMNLWDTSKDANATRLLGVIIYIVLKQNAEIDPEFLKNISAYCLEKSHHNFDELKNWIKAVDYYKLETQTLISLRAIESLRLLPLLSADELYLKLHNISISELDLAFQANPKLRQLPVSLNLCGNSLRDEQVVDLVKNVLENSNITSLNLTTNDIGAIGAQALAQFLMQNYTLQNLSLGANKIDHLGAQAFGQALLQNKVLKELDFWGNLIGDSGAIALAKGLKHNSTLQKLDLKKNVIGESGREALRDLKQSRLELSIDVEPDEPFPIWADDFPFLF